MVFQNLVWSFNVPQWLVLRDPIVHCSFSYGLIAQFFSNFSICGIHTSFCTCCWEVPRKMLIDRPNLIGFQKAYFIITNETLHVIARCPRIAETLHFTHVLWRKQQFVRKDQTLCPHFARAKWLTRCRRVVSHTIDLWWQALLATAIQSIASIYRWGAICVTSPIHFLCFLSLGSNLVLCLPGRVKRESAIQLMEWRRMLCATNIQSTVWLRFSHVCWGLT